MNVGVNLFCLDQMVKALLKYRLKTQDRNKIRNSIKIWLKYCWVLYQLYQSSAFIVLNIFSLIRKMNVFSITQFFLYDLFLFCVSYNVAALTWGSGFHDRVGRAGPRSASDWHLGSSWLSTAWPGWAAPGPESPGLCPALSSQNPPQLVPHPAAMPFAPQCTLVWPSDQSKKCFFW